MADIIPAPKKEIDGLIDSLYEQFFDEHPSLEYIASVPACEDQPNEDEYYIEVGFSQEEDLKTFFIPVLKKSGKFIVPDIYIQYSVGDNKREELIGKKSDNKLIRPFNLQYSVHKIRPLCSGINIGHHYTSELGGTLGAIIEIEESDHPYIMSNFHVLSGRAKVRNRLISQPCENVTNGFKIKNAIAQFKYGYFGDFVDVGFAKILDPSIVSSGSVFGKESPNGFDLPQDGDIVEKFGISSGLTEGIIRSTNMYVRYRKHQSDRLYHIFKKQILLSCMSKGGDSGSLIINKKSNKAVGLIFGGDSEHYTAANNITYIFGTGSLRTESLKNITFKKFI